jgi:RimJ/RimL family protein N-acetyltransferase
MRAPVSVCHAGVMDTSACLRPIVLADGTRFAARQLEPRDRWAVEAVFAGLGDASRHARFGGAKTRLNERELEYLTAVDHHDHEALLALDERSGRPVAVARFVRDPGEPSTAEVAFAIVDEWQGRGLGTRLTELLACRARSERIERFRATVLRSNTRAVALLKRLSDDVRVALEGGSLEITVALGRRA